MVRANLAGLTVQRWHKILPSPQTLFYRNKMEYSFGDRRDIEILNRPKGERGPSPVIAEGENIVHLGLHPKGRFAIVTPTPECQLMSEETQAVIATVSCWATDRTVPIFVRKSGHGDLRHLVIREGKNTGERLVNLVARSQTAHVDDLATRLRASGVPITTFLFSAYDGLSDVAGADSRRVVWGDGAIQERLGKISFTVTPASFMQTNTRAAERLIQTLHGWSVEDGASAPRRVLIDLYCGSGAIGLNLAASHDEVFGVEINADAVRDAWLTAKANGVPNMRFFEGRAEDVAGELPVKERAAGATVVVDPPRAGLHAKLVATILAWGAPTLYYVSCNPETLARDLRLLVERYSIVDVQPLDFFPHTDHVETAVRLKLRDKGN
jgi:23S rRNA (uracil1939-C5)-methyltransferase